MMFAADISFPIIIHRSGSASTTADWRNTITEYFQDVATFTYFDALDSVATRLFEITPRVPYLTFSNFSGQVSYDSDYCTKMYNSLLNASRRLGADVRRFT